MADKDKDPVIEGEIVKEQAVVPAAPAQPQELAVWKPSFSKAAVDEAIIMVAEKRRFFDGVMQSGSHYSIIPGQKPTPEIDQATGTPTGRMIPPKPTLLKPGAELLNAAMGLHPELVTEEQDEDWTGEAHGGEPFFRYRRRCNIWRQTGPGTEDRMLVASASGECNSWEEKYRYRGSGRTCPICGAVGAIIKGNPTYAPTVDGKRGSAKMPGFEQGGFVCWEKKGGCKASFPDADTRITAQDTTKQKHPNPADLVNTILKMADKRALVAATLLATGCSDLFTQDIEDGQNGSGAGATSAQAPAERPGEDAGAPSQAPAAPAAAKAPTARPVGSQAISADACRRITDGLSAMTDGQRTALRTYLGGEGWKTPADIWKNATPKQGNDILALLGLPPTPEPVAPAAAAAPTLPPPPALAAAPVPVQPITEDDWREIVTTYNALDAGKANDTYARQLGMFILFMNDPKVANGDWATLRAHGDLRDKAFELLGLPVEPKQ